MVCLIWIKVLVNWRINREATWWTEQVWFWLNSKYNKVIVFLGLEVWQLINSPEVTRECPSAFCYWGAVPQSPLPPDLLSVLYVLTSCITTWHRRKTVMYKLASIYLLVLWVCRLKLSRQFHLLLSLSSPSVFFPTKPVI